MFEPELKYCPKCKDEYRSEIIKCASCDLLLLTGKEMMGQEDERLEKLNQRSMEFSAGDKMATIFRGSHVEIKALEDILKGERIASLVKGDEDGCGKGCRPENLELQVRAQDAEEALALIQTRYHLSTGLAEYDRTFADEVFDPQQGDATCPACGHCFATSITTCPECGLCLG